jgi:hypothetical protein
MFLQHSLSMDLEECLLGLAVVSKGPLRETVAEGSWCSPKELLLVVSSLVVGSILFYIISPEPKREGLE